MAITWAREANTTISNFFKNVENDTLRRRIVSAMLMDKGKILYNQHGLDLVWRARYLESPTVPLSEGTGFGSISQINRWKTLQLDWRAWGKADAISKLEQLKNDGPQAIVRVVRQMAEGLSADMDVAFAEQLYNDGNANTSGLHGFTSFTSVSGAATSGFVGVNNDTYAGLNTALGTYGGAWSADTWPYAGTGDTSYDFFTPVIVDYSDTAWSASTKTWPNTCEEALGFGIMAAAKNASSGGLDLIVTDQQMFRQFKEKVRTKENLYVTRGASDSAPYRLGFKDTIFFDGVDIGWEYGVPVDASGNGQAFGWSFDIVELLCMQDRMFVTNQDTRLEDQMYRVTVDFYGNLKFGNERGGIRSLCAFRKIT